MKEQQIAAIYCRLSKEDLDKANIGDESESIQNQKLLLLDYAVNNGFLVHTVYVDEDLSGFSDRPGFKKMIMDASKGEFNTIICKHQSRFTRDMELVEKYIHGYFVEWGIRFISLTDNVDTNIKGNKKARQIYGLINEWFSEDLSTNIRAVFKKKMENGQFLGSFTCYGYIKDTQDKHKIIVDEEAASIVKEIFSLYLDGYGAGKIAAMLTQRKVLTPTQHKVASGLKFKSPNTKTYSEKYGVWAVNTIRRILRNEAYIGTLIQGRERKVSYKSKRVVIAPKDDWVVIKNNHEPIIEESDFYKVQSVIESNRRGYVLNMDESMQEERTKPHVLAGKVKCADCGNTIERGGLSRDRSVHYLRCKLSNRTRRRECTPHCIRQDNLEHTILTRIQESFTRCLGDSKNNVLEEAIAQLNGKKDPGEIIKKQLTKIETEIESIQRSAAMTYKDKLNGLLTEDDFISFRAVFDKEKKELIKQKEVLDKEMADLELSLKSRRNLDDLLKKYMVISELTHHVINDFIDSIFVGERDPITKEHPITINWMF